MSYEVGKLFYSKNKTNRNKPKHHKICGKCGKAFLGYVKQKYCPECRKKTKPQNSCSRCGRKSSFLYPFAKGTTTEELLCSFCSDHVRGLIRNYKERPNPDYNPKFSKVCPECRKTFETTWKVKIYCCVECESKFNFKLRLKEKVKQPNAT